MAFPIPSAPAYFAGKPPRKTATANALQPRLNEIQAKSAESARSLLGKLIVQGALQPESVRTICDFGAGMGGPAHALLETFPNARGGITAVEIRPAEGYLMRMANILPDESVRIEDGVRHLEARPQAYDLNTAFNLGPDHGPLTTRLLNAARTSLKPGGQVMICSDQGTMRDVMAICQGNKLDTRQVTGHWEFGTAGICRQAVVISNLAGRQEAIQRVRPTFGKEG